VVVHEHKGGETYANIAACTPDKSREPLVPCGKYVRVKDRPPEGRERLSARAAGEATTTDSAAVKVHVGRYNGLELRDLAPEQVRF
jgi:hypothetical protein